ncbi:MAG: hypothetical protein ACREH4_10140 [Vitreimonas sp.]
MSKLDVLIQRARALPPEEQDALADEMQTWLDAPPLPDDFGADGSDEELAKRVNAWRANPVVIPAAELHALLKGLRDEA